MTVTHDERSAAIESILREWLTDPEVIVICGHWGSGALMELVPQGHARLSPQKYDESFAGLRDLIIEGERHHVHLDLCRFQSVVYAVLPSVCYGFRPSFEVHFVERDQVPELLSSPFSLSVQQPYEGQRVRRPRVLRYFRRLLDHAHRYPTLVRFRMESTVSLTQLAQPEWGDIVICLYTAMKEGNIPAAESPHQTAFHVWLRQFLSTFGTLDATT